MGATRFRSDFSYRKISYVLGSNWSQKVSKLVSKTAKKVSNPKGVTWRKKSSDEKNLEMTPPKWCHDKLVLIGFEMTNGVRSFDGNV